jgi:hypothetical protein
MMGVVEEAVCAHCNLRHRLLVTPPFTCSLAPFTPDSEHTLSTTWLAVTVRLFFMAYGFHS